MNKEGSHRPSRSAPLYIGFTPMHGIYYLACTYVVSLVPTNILTPIPSTEHKEPYIPID